MKTESVYPEHWEECACDEVLVMIDDYIHWYNHARIKRSFGWMSPVECRQRTKEGLRDCLQENVRSTFPMRKGRIFAYRPIRLFIADYANKETILWSNVLTALLPA